MNMSDPGYLDRQYGTDEALRIRVETHRMYGVSSGEHLFDTITRAMLEVGARPAAILDVGAGTGNWYRAIRRQVGPDPQYTGVDQSAGMVQALTGTVMGDPRACVLAGDAEKLPCASESFDWVGLHFMLYHVPRIHLALQEAWRVLKPGGTLTAATNGPRPYRELADLGDEVAAELGLSGAGALSIERFNLANGAQFFPAPPLVRVFPTGFRFPEAAPAVRYMASGPLWAHLGEAAQDAAIRERAVTVLRDRVEAAIRRDGGFNVHSESGFFLLRKG